MKEMQEYRYDPKMLERVREIIKKNENVKISDLPDNIEVYNKDLLRAIRIHGSGNYVMFSEYLNDNVYTVKDGVVVKHTKPIVKKRIANTVVLDNALKDRVPIWIDTMRMSKVQLANVMSVINEKYNDSVDYRTFRRDGRPMILVEKKDRGLRLDGKK